MCGESLSRADGALRCPNRHSFDISKHGYVSLLTGSAPRSGDDPAMVRARERFLAGGAYAPIRAAIAAMAADAPIPPSTVLEVGCGTGYYLAGMLDALPEARGLGLDSSPRALQAAAKAHPRAAAVGSDVFGTLPVASSSVDLVLDAFAPRNPAEFHRVLRPDGRLLVARPTDRHLARLLDAVEGSIGVDPAKEERLHRALDPWFDPVETEALEFVATLTSAEAADLVAMTPSAHHVTAGADPEAEADRPTEEVDTEIEGERKEIEVSILLTAYSPSLVSTEFAPS